MISNYLRLAVTSLMLLNSVQSFRALTSRVRGIRKYYRPPADKEYIFPSRRLPRKEELEKFDELKRNSTLPTFWIDTLSEDQIERGIVELRKYCSDQRMEKFDKVLNARTDKIQFVFENPANANNVWASLRTLECFGMQQHTVIMEDNLVDKSWRKQVMGSAMGTQKWLTLNSETNTFEALTKLREQGFRIAASDIHESSKSVNEIDWCAQKTVIVMGNEDRGISGTVKLMADERFFIPMKGFAESLNLSAASAITCAVLESQGALKPSIDPLQRKRLLLTWMARTVQGSIPILRQHAGLPIVGNKLYNSLGSFTTRP
jgi:tRNA (guanosine-2'-O-)-methyltransferase